MKYNLKKMQAVLKFYQVKYDESFRVLNDFIEDFEAELREYCENCPRYQNGCGDCNIGAFINEILGE